VATQAALPGLNCGLCGAPTCKELARDVSMGDASKQDCIFLSKDRLQELRRAYLRRSE
jgi:Na+-translocating ferredoxin:NAD+ oxidoreductase RNF subunit RnfB